MDLFTPSILDHLEELRIRILRSLLGLMIALIPGLLLASPALDSFLAFACPPALHLTYIRPMELFFTELELALVIALILAAPYISFQLWQFVSPGLHLHERRLVIRLSGFSSLLFLGGVFFALVLVFPAIMRFSLGMATPSIRPNLVIDSVLSLALSLSLGFGLMFQLPIVVLGLVRLGLVQSRTISRHRPLVVTIIFILAAILTPPDVISQLTLGIPTWLLFELSLLLCRRLEPLPVEAVASHASPVPPSEPVSSVQEEAVLPLEAPEVFSYSETMPRRRIRNLTPGRHFRHKPTDGD